MPLQECFISAEAQPPLPLQEFLPAQPASPLLQPPCPLQAFMPLQTCFSDFASGLSLAPFSSLATGLGFSPVLGALVCCAFTRPEPASTPATARPIAFVVRSPFFIHFSFPSPSGDPLKQRSGPHDRTGFRFRFAPRSYPSRRRVARILPFHACSRANRSRTQTSRARYANAGPLGFR